MAEAHEKEALLQDEQNKSQDLATRVHRLEVDLQEAAEKYREQVHLKFMYSLEKFSDVLHRNKNYCLLMGRSMTYVERLISIKDECENWKSISKATTGLRNWRSP